MLVIDDEGWVVVDGWRHEPGSVAANEALAPFVASRAELLAVHEDLGARVQELIAAETRVQELSQALEACVSRLRTVNADVFMNPRFTDRGGDADANDRVWRRGLEVLKRHGRE